MLLCIAQPAHSSRGLPWGVGHDVCKWLCTPTSVALLSTNGLRKFTTRLQSSQRSAWGDYIGQSKRTMSWQHTQHATHNHYSSTHHFRQAISIARNIHRLLLWESDPQTCAMTHHLGAPSYLEAAPVRGMQCTQITFLGFIAELGQRPISSHNLSESYSGEKQDMSLQRIDRDGGCRG